MQIFLSYASEDKPVAEAIAFSLRARGHKVFLDRDDLPPGGEYDRRIEQAVERSGLFVFLITPASVTRGRFTLTELEFARRKWRKADGHVLPILIQATDFKDIPTFLKAVTILEPKGNISAEVSAAVDALRHDSIPKRVLLFGGLGLFSGIMMPQFESLLKIALGGLDINFSFFGNQASFWLQSAIFALCLLGGIRHRIGFRYRQLLLIFFVIVGWISAVNTALVMPNVSYRDMGSSIDETYCNNKDSATESASNFSSETECLKMKAEFYENKLKKQQSFWYFVIAYGAAGAVGAFFAAMGIPNILRRQSFETATALAAVSVAGALAAGAWATVNHFGIMGSASLFPSWQMIVAAVFGIFL